jgi:opacity protein-like surface antigen
VTISPAILAAAAAAVLLAPPRTSAQDMPRVHVRVAAGYDASRDTRLGDRACDAAPLLNFFGCQPGTDDRPIGAPGGFGSSAALDVAAGVRLAPVLRIEAGVSHRPGFEFDGNATFLASGDEQPVRAEAAATAILARGFLDLAPLLPLGPVEPFFGAGVGGSRTRISDVLYTFPGLAAQPATTMTSGGIRWRRAWDVNAGVAVRAGGRTRIEGAYRYADFGRVETDDGTIDVVRGTRQFIVDNVAGTHARLRSHGAWFGIRQDF